jgi:bacillolysin
MVSDANQAKDLILKNGAKHLNVNLNDDLNLFTSKRDKHGNVYYKFKQTYKGLNVYGNEMIVQTDRSNMVNLVYGQFHDNIDLDINPAMNGNEALKKGIGSWDNQPLSDVRVHEDTVLSIYVNDDAPTLVYTAVVEFNDKTGYHFEELFVDANTGEVVNSVTRMYNAIDRRIYDLKSKCVQSNNDLPGTYRFGNDLDSDADTHEKSAHVNSGHTYWFYKHLLDRDSLDGKGGKLNSSVHGTFPGRDRWSQCHGANAYFMGSPYNQMVYGDGGNGFVNPAGSLDIVGHELTHGVVYEESNLEYKDEPGALNESLADIFGAGASAWVESGGSSSGNPSGGIVTSKATWIAGEDAVEGGLRNMSDPASDGSSPDNFSDKKTGSEDNGYVHYNSGISNLGFYLASDGGKHPRGETSNQVIGMGMEKALKIYYHANVNLFTKSTGFKSARKLLAQSAETLYGECSDEWRTINQSQDAIKVPGEWDDTCSNESETDTSDNDTTETDPPPQSRGNLALDGVASSFNEYNSSYGPKYTNDGKTTIWASKTIYNTRDTNWVMIDLKSVSSFNNVKIHWRGNDYAKEYAVYAYQNGGWTEMGTYSKYNEGVSNVDLTTTNAQYVAVTMRSGNYGRWYLIEEIEIN